MAEPDVTPRFGVAIESLEQSHDAVHLRDSDGIKHGPYDLLVIADGTRSRLRDQLGLRSYFKEYAYGALFALVPDEGHVFGRTLHQVHAGPGTHTTLGFLPTGLPWQGGIDTVGDGVADTAAESVTTLYYNLRADEYADWQRGGLQKWKDQCSALMPHAAEVIQGGMHTQEQVTFARYSDGGMWRYNRGRCVVIGDAAHSMSPQLGQGANLALIDAEKLVDSLAAGGVTSTSGDSVEAALDDYTKQRWWRLNFYQAQSRILTPFFAPRSESLRQVRNALLNPGCHTPVLQNFMQSVLCGAHSASLLNPYSTIPDNEFLGVLEGLPHIGAAISELEEGVRPPKRWPCE